VKKIFLLFNYITYRLKSTNEHGVHSPFVYDLLTNVIYNRTDYYAYQKIETLRAHLYLSEQKINCIDLGAGAIRNSISQKQVKHIAKHSAKSAKHAQLLFRLVNHFQPAIVLELGTSLGISTAYMASPNSKTQLITIEGCPEIATLAQQNIKQFELKNVEYIVGNFDDVLPAILTRTEKVDFVFFDGNHRKQATLNYFYQCLLKAHEGSIFVFDDIYWSEEMKEAWNEIKNNDQVTVTIDLFFMGIIFFRKEQVKQHFVIKF
jgi:predicted O-methyltransferase YrrM